MLTTLMQVTRDFAFNAMGLGIAKAHRLPFIHEKLAIRELLAYLDIDCVFDVGAHEGEYRDLLRSIGYEGQIVSFEPIPALASALRERAKGDSLWRIEETALDSESRQVEFHVAASDSLSSIHAPLSGGPFGSDIAPANKLTIQTLTLEQYIQEHREKFSRARAFLKMDTQGHDLAIASGAGQLLGEFAGIQTEVPIAPLYEDQPTFGDTIAFFEANGFAVNALLSTHYAFPTLIEVDFLLINKNKIHSPITTSYRRQR